MIEAFKALHHWLHQYNFDESEVEIVIKSRDHFRMADSLKLDMKPNIQDFAKAKDWDTTSGTIYGIPFRFEKK